MYKIFTQVWDFLNRNHWIQIESENTVRSLVLNCKPFPLHKPNLRYPYVSCRKHKLMEQANNYKQFNSIFWMLLLSFCCQKVNFLLFLLSHCLTYINIILSMDTKRHFFALWHPMAYYNASFSHLTTTRYQHYKLQIIIVIIIIVIIIITPCFWCIQHLTFGISTHFSSFPLNT